METEAIKQRIELLKQLNASRNRYTFNPPATEEQLVKFEQQFGITLPAVYRWFVKHIANGIVVADPIYSIVSAVNFEKPFFRETDFNPGIEFPLTQRICGNDKADRVNDNYPYETDYRHFTVSEVSNGCITLLGWGGGTTSFLVVNGKEYGNVWCDNNISNYEVFPEFDSSTNRRRLTFTDWINMQLARAIESPDHLL